MIPTFQDITNISCDVFLALYSYNIEFILIIVQKEFNKVTIADI